MKNTNIENKKIITIFSVILVFTILLFGFTTFTVVSEKDQVLAKLEENKDLITKSERIKVLNKNNEEIDLKIKEISEKITDLENQKSLLEENKGKNNGEIKELKNSLVK